MVRFNPKTMTDRQIDTRLNTVNRKIGRWTKSLESATTEKAKALYKNIQKYSAEREKLMNVKDSRQQKVLKSLKKQLGSVTVVLKQTQKGNRPSPRFQKNLMAKIAELTKQINNL